MLYGYIRILIYADFLIQKNKKGEKMKKTLLSIVVIISVIGVAKADIVEKLKGVCLQHPDKLVWVEKTQRCIPINPCNSDDKKIRAAYCNQIFNETITYGSLYKGLIELYADMQGIECEPIESKSLDKNYIMCKGSDVMVFEFADIRAGSLGDYRQTAGTVAKALCDAVSAKQRKGAPHCKVDEITCDKIADIVIKYRPGEIKSVWYSDVGEECVVELNVSPTIITIKSNGGQHYTTLGELDPGYDSSEAHFTGF